MGEARGWWVVCHYSPPGNVIGIPGYFATNVGKQISGSPNVGISGDVGSPSIPMLPSSPVTLPETSNGWRVGKGIYRVEYSLACLFWGLVCGHCCWRCGLLQFLGFLTLFEEWTSSPRLYGAFKSFIEEYG
jgi:hypothetical protein